MQWFLLKKKAFHHRGIFTTQSNLTHWEWAGWITQAQNCTKTDATGEASVKTHAKMFSTMFLNLRLAYSILSPLPDIFAAHNLLPCCPLSWVIPQRHEIREQNRGKTCSNVVLAGLLSASSLSCNHITGLTLQLFPQLGYKYISLFSLQTIILTKLLETQHLWDLSPPVKFC